MPIIIRMTINVIATAGSTRNGLLGDDIIVELGGIFYFIKIILSV